MGFTGAGAVIDLLSEYEELEVIGNDDEFPIVYIPDGVEDLEYRLHTSPSRWRGADTAFYRFQKVVDYYSLPRMPLNTLCGGKFREISEKYIESLTQTSWAGSTEGDRKTEGSIFYFRVRFKLQHTVNSVLKKKLLTFPVRTMRYSVLGDEFYGISRDYIAELISSMKRTDKKITVLNQPFAGDNPEKSFKYYNDPRAIIVDRDPRDTYLFAKYRAKGEAYWIPTEDVKAFVGYYRSMRENTPKVSYENRDRVLYIRFEDLIYDTGRTVSLIEDFTGAKEHSRPKTHFIPEVSKKNTNLSEYYPDEKENIEYITENLGKYLYDFRGQR